MCIRDSTSSGARALEGPDVPHCYRGPVVGLAWAWLCQGPTRCPRLPSKGSPCFTWPSPGPSFLTGGTPRAFLVCCLRFCWITTVPLDLLHLPAPIDEVGHAPSLSQRSGSLWHSPVQKLKDSTTYGERPGSTKANNRDITVLLHFPQPLVFAARELVPWAAVLAP